MTELVRQHGPHLALVDHLEQPPGHRDRRVMLVSAGGEGVGLGHLAHVEARHRHALCLGQLADDPVVIRHLLLGDGLGPAGGDGDPVGEPVEGEVEAERDDEGDDGALATAHPLPDQHEESAERRTERITCVQADRRERVTSGAKLTVARAHEGREDVR